MNTALEVRDLQVELESESGLVRAIDGLRLAIERGETFALVGESGCGKSMTALALMRLLPENGYVAGGDIHIGTGPERVDVLGLPESQMRSVRGGRIGMIFQEPATSLNPVMPIGRQIVEAIEAHTPLRGAAARSPVRSVAVLRGRGRGPVDEQLRRHDQPGAQRDEPRPRGVVELRRRLRLHGHGGAGGQPVRRRRARRVRPAGAGVQTATPCAHNAASVRQTHTVKEFGMLDLDRITHYPGLMGGRPCIRGMRVTVGMLVRQIAAGATVDELLVEYPYLEREDIAQALRYAAWRTEERELHLSVP